MDQPETDFIELGEGDDGEAATEAILTSPQMTELRKSLLLSGTLNAYSNWLRTNRPNSPTEAAMLLFAATQFANDLLSITGALLMDPARVEEGAAGIVEYLQAELASEIRTQKSIMDAIQGAPHGEDNPIISEV